MVKKERKREYTEAKVRRRKRELILTKQKMWYMEIKRKKAIIMTQIESVIEQIETEINKNKIHINKNKE